MRLHLRLYQLRYLAVEAVDRSGLYFIQSCTGTVYELLEGGKVFVQGCVETARGFQPECTVAVVEQGDKAELFTLLLCRYGAEDERQLLQQGGGVIR